MAEIRWYSKSAERGAASRSAGDASATQIPHYKRNMNTAFVRMPLSALSLCSVLRGAAQQPPNIAVSVAVAISVNVSVFICPFFVLSFKTTMSVVCCVPRTYPPVTHHILQPNLTLRNDLALRNPLQGNPIEHNQTLLNATRPYVMPTYSTQRNANSTNTQ